MPCAASKKNNSLKHFKTLITTINTNFSNYYCNGSSCTHSSWLLVIMIIFAIAFLCRFLKLHCLFALKRRSEQRHLNIAPLRSHAATALSAAANVTGELQSQAGSYQSSWSKTVKVNWGTHHQDVSNWHLFFARYAQFPCWHPEHSLNHNLVICPVKSSTSALVINCLYPSLNNTDFCTVHFEWSVKIEDAESTQKFSWQILKTKQNSCVLQMNLFCKCGKKDKEFQEQAIRIIGWQATSELALKIGVLRQIGENIVKNC